MKRAFSLALKGKGLTSPNPLVGAVIVKGNKVAGSGYHKRAGSPHAEILALKSAGEKAKGATLYINLEPCVHYGRTPPCAPKIIKAGIKRVIIAMEDPNPKVKGKGVKLLEEAGLDVQVEVLQEEAYRINEVYRKYISKGLPFVTLKWAMSLDGKIATFKGDSRWISHQPARDLVHKLRGEHDAVMVGINTLLKDDSLLTTHGKGKKEPKRIIVDSQGRTPLQSRCLKEGEGQVILATTAKIGEEKKEHLEEAGVEVIIVASKNQRVDLRELLPELARREITSILVEGGGEIIASLLEERLADKIVCFLSPMIIGGKEATTPVEGKGAEKIAQAIDIRRVESKRIGEDLLLEGYISYG